MTTNAEKVKDLQTRVQIIEEKIARGDYTIADIKEVCAENATSIKKLQENTNTLISGMQTVKGIKAFLFKWVSPAMVLFLLFKDVLK